MANDYVGRYGNALRTLTALEQPPLPSAISPNAPQPGAFQQPQAAPQPQPGAFNTPQTPMPQAMPTAPAQPAMQDDSAGGKPISAQQLYKDMPADVKDDLLKQIESSGHNIDEVYAQKVASGEIQPPRKEPTKHDKLGYIAEVALRTISNLSRQNTQGASDWADAVLTTDARRAGVQDQEDERFRKSVADQNTRRRALDDQTRKETHDDQGALRERAGRAADIETQQAFTGTENDKNRANDLEVARMREAGDDRRSKNAKGEVFTADDGSVYRLDGDKASPVTTKTKVTTQVAGKRGVKFNVEKEVDKQLKAMPRSKSSDIDKDTVMRNIGLRIKELKGDRKIITELRSKGITGSAIDDEIAKRAREQVMAEYEDVSGGGSESEAPTQRKANVFDQF